MLGAAALNGLLFFIVPSKAMLTFMVIAGVLSSVLAVYLAVVIFKGMALKKRMIVCVAALQLSGLGHRRYRCLVGGGTRRCLA